MEIRGTVTKIPVATTGKTPPNPEVIELIEVVKGLADGQYLEVAFPDQKTAYQRAQALRNFDLTAKVRNKMTVYVGKNGAHKDN